MLQETFIYFYFVHMQAALRERLCMFVGSCDSWYYIM